MDETTPIEEAKAGLLEAGYQVCTYPALNIAEGTIGDKTVTICCYKGKFVLLGYEGNELRYQELPIESTSGQICSLIKSAFQGK